MEIIRLEQELNSVSDGEMKQYDDERKDYILTNGGNLIMIIKYECTNISSKDPKGLAEFYRAIGVPVYVDNENCVGWRLGNKEDAYICVWDENRWGKSTAGFITSVFKVDDLQEIKLFC